MNDKKWMGFDHEVGEVLEGVLPTVRIPGKKGFKQLRIVRGRIASITEGEEDPQALPLMVVPPFVDSHFHLDSVYSLEETGENRSGTLWEGISLWKEYKERLTVDKIYNRALRYCKEASQQGIGAIRSHVDVSYDSLIGVEALLELKSALSRQMNIQLVAFPQDGYLRNPRGQQNLERALDAGVDVVGGIPHFERTYAQGEESIDLLCRLAAEKGLRVDLHCDETDDARSRHIETLAAKTVEYGLQGRVSASHATSLHSVDTAWFQKLVPLLLDAGVCIIPNPLINITLQGRADTYPKRRGVTRIPELIKAGIPVALGQDCVCDPWYPLGRGSMLDVAHMTAHVSQLTGSLEMESLLDLITVNGANAMGWEAYGIREGQPANFLLFQAGTFTEMLRQRRAPLWVVRDGRLLCRTISPAVEQATFSES